MLRFLPLPRYQCPRFYAKAYPMNRSYHKTLNAFPVIIEIPVAWGELDAFQHVNNTVYFRYFESVRIAYFQYLDWFNHIEQIGVGPILASTCCTFKFPLGYPDTVAVGAKIIAIEQDRFTMRYRAVSQQHRRLVADADGLIVTFDYRVQRKAPLPDELRQKIADLESAYPPLSE